MVFQNLSIKLILGLLSAAFIIAKLFSAVVFLGDDPTVFLIYRLSPSLDNTILLSTMEYDKYSIILSDENGFVGESIYYLIVNYLWWAIPVAFISYLLIGCARRFSSRDMNG